MKLNYNPSYTGYSDLIEDFDLNELEIDEQLLQKWTNDIVDELSTDEQLVHKVGLFSIQNYKTTKPAGLSMINSAAYRLEKPDNCGTPREQIKTWVQQVSDDCELEIEIKCQKCGIANCSCNSNQVVVEVDRIWELSNAHFHYPLDFARFHKLSKGEADTTGGWKPLGYKDSDWFNIEKYISNCVEVNCVDCEYAFTLEGPNIEVNYEKGELLLAYLSKPMDEDGNLLIPDDPQVYRAITDYLIYRIFRKRFYKSGAPTDQRIYKDAQAEYERSLGVARTKLQLPNTQSWNNWIKNNRYYKVNNGLENLYERGHSRAARADRDPRRPLMPTERDLYRDK